MNSIFRLKESCQIRYSTISLTENILENAQELALLKTCFEESSQQYEKASRLARQIKVTTDENLFLASTFSKLDLKGDLGEDPWTVKYGRYNMKSLYFVNVMIESVQSVVTSEWWGMQTLNNEHV